MAEQNQKEGEWFEYGPKLTVGRAIYHLLEWSEERNMSTTMNERAKLAQTIVQAIEEFPKVHKFLTSGIAAGLKISLTAAQAQILITFNHWKHCEIVEYSDCVTGKIRYDMDYWQTKDKKHHQSVNPRTVEALLKKGMLTRLPDNYLIIVTSQEWKEATAKAKGESNG